MSMVSSIDWIHALDVSVGTVHGDLDTGIVMKDIDRVWVSIFDYLCRRDE